MKMSRRIFLGGMGAALGSSRLKLTMAEPGSVSGLDGPPVFIHMFLRGGMDGLSFMPPRTGANYSNYEAMRPNIRIRPSANAPDDENYSRNLNGAFGIHPRCTALRSLYQAGDLSFVHAVGHPASARSRSHFDSMEYIELGTPGNQSTSTGWLTRHLQTAPNLPGNPLLQTLCASGSPPTSLLGRLNVATLASTSDFHPNSGTYEDTHLIALQQLYAGAGTLDAAMGHAVDTVQLLSSFDLDDYVPAGGAEYPNSGLGDDLAMIAQLIRLNLGLQVATVDAGGWDDHNGLGDDGGGNFGNRIGDVSESIAAFWQDITAAGLGNRVVLVMQTEFGRRVRQNDDRGVDHGSGAPMMVLGRHLLNGGGIYGDFNGLANSDLLDGEDVYPTTDYRQVLAELVLSVLGNPNIDIVFPGLNLNPVGVAQSEIIFSSNFETA